MSNYATPTFFFFQILFTLILEAEEIRCMITWESRCCADLSGDKPQSLGLVSMDPIGVAFPHTNDNVFFPQSHKLFAI